MSLVCLGYDASFELGSGSFKKAPQGAALLFDRTGQYWPSSSILIQRFERQGSKAKPNRFTRDWFGKNYDLRSGVVNLPPRPLGDWTSLGEVRRLLYTRGSGDDREAKHEGDFEHGFGERGLFEVFTFSRSRKLPQLYSRSGAFRIEIGRGCVIDGRGIVSP